jgi:diaminohydroxyphosphoribosylaminopyrimidine deaminase / 5-amino-6-(5-phosphoribosylamino)uracil reductase
MLMQHTTYMQRCLYLAQLGQGSVAPNPMVGAVLVHNGNIIGEGYHMKYGQAHAEVNCISSVLEVNKHLIKESTLYVSLEPCAHYGKTPPCANFIVDNGIPNVVIGCRDNYEEVDGKGIAFLEKHGVQVVFGVLEAQCLALNKYFFTYHKKKRPYIILKWAQTADGFIGSGTTNRVHITNNLANALVHYWRSQYSAIMVGKNTLQLDNPFLTARGIQGNQPTKIIIAPSGLTATNFNALNGNGKTLVFTALPAQTKNHVQFIKINNSTNFLEYVLTQLYNLNVQTVLVEGGFQLLQGFINSNIWDEARVFTNTELYINNGIKAPLVNNRLLVNTTQMEKNVLHHYINNF